MSNQSYEEWYNSLKDNTIIRISWSWSEDTWRNKMNRLSKKGYFKKKSSKGIDIYTKTNKKWVKGDTLKKPIAYSFQKS